MLEVMILRPLILHRQLTPEFLRLGALAPEYVLQALCSHERFSSMHVSP